MQRYEAAFISAPLCGADEQVQQNKIGPCRSLAQNEKAQKGVRQYRRGRICRAARARKFRRQERLCRQKAQTIRENYGTLIFDFQANTSYDMSIKIDGNEVIKGMVGKGNQKEFKFPTGKHVVNMDFIVEKGESESFNINKG